MHLLCLFSYAFCLAMLIPLFFPSLHLLFFAPFLVRSLYQLSLPKCLWWALGCGFMIDLLSSQTRLGTYAINYCLVIVCLYRYRYYFFEDRLSTLPIMTFCFVFLSILIQAGIFYAIGKPFFLTWDWTENNLFSIPFQNSIYAGFAFTFPSLIISNLKRPVYLFFFNLRRKL
jgi:rod shape-determining protein MreD